MKRRTAMLWICLVLFAASVLAQEQKPSEKVHHIGRGRSIGIGAQPLCSSRGYRVEESQHAKDAARSSYFPNLRNDTMTGNVTDTQFIAIPQGKLGTAAGTPIPEQTAVLNQGGLSFVTSGTQLSQPLLELWKVRSANDVAASEIKAMRNKAEDNEKPNRAYKCTSSTTRS